MDILRVDAEQVTQLGDLPECLPESGFLWLDIIRGEDCDWPQLVLKLTGVSIHERHVADCYNEAHPSHYDGT